MNEEQILEMLKNMSPEELAALESTTYPEDIVKQANADLAKGDLVNALVGYGMYRADLDLASFEAGEEDLSKEASAEFEAANAELEEVIDAALEASGIFEIEDEAEMQKEAQAAAGLIFAGYMDQLEKVAAADAKKAKSVMGMLKGKAHAMKAHAMKAGKKAAKHVAAHGKKHKGHYAAGAVGAAAGFGAMAAKKHMDKKASELTVAELTEEVISKVAAEQTIIEGFEKAAAAGHKMGEKLMKHLKGGAKHVAAHGKKHGGKYLAAAGGAAAGAAAHKAKKD